MNNTKKRSAIILCGGKGTRLGSIGKKIPKTLVKIQGEEILKYILSHLIKYRFDNIILPVGYKGQMIKKFINKYDKIKKIVKVVPTGQNTEIGKRIAFVEKFIKSDQTLILNGDAIFDFNINNIYKTHKKNNFDVSFLSGEITYPYGTVGVKNNKVIDFKRSLKYHALKVRNRVNYTAFNYTGIILINSSILKKYKNYFKKFNNFEAEFYPLIIKRFKAQLHILKSFWHSIDNVKDISSANNVKENRIKFYKIKKLKKNLIK